MKEHRQRKQPDATPTPMFSAVAQQRREVLNYFGDCPKCGYTAHAFVVVTHHFDSRVLVETVGSCGVPCGWSGPVTLTKMTESW
ncbi:hypothetical protein [Nocardia nova]|uniref:hypothetical protein n=1 Tax=Nocardia nova TaxID=37330 RepID=UPI0033F93B9E